MMWIVAIVSMCVVLLAHHLGFIDKAYNVVGEVAKCSMCSVFWVTLLVLLYYKTYILEAIALSFLMAYLSNWIAIMLDYISEIYEIIWQKSRRQLKSWNKRK